MAKKKLFMDNYFVKTLTLWRQNTNKIDNHICSFSVILYLE